jgi:hemerythrin
MDILKWSDELSVGSDVLDAHHKHLFVLLTEIGRAARGGGGLGVVVGVLAELTDYIAYHFREEEAMMEKVAFPLLAQHRASHEAIAMKVHEMAERVDVGNFRTFVAELQAFLEEWLIHHIEIEDFEYRPYMGVQPD